MFVDVGSSPSLKMSSSNRTNQDDQRNESSMPRFFQFFKRRRRSNSISRPSKDHDESTVDRKPPSRSSSMHNMERSKSSDSLVSVISADMSVLTTAGLLDSFASTTTVERVRRRQSGKMRLEKIVMTPYFGHFAGQRIHFDLRRNAESLINIKVRNEDQVLASLLYRQAGRKKETVRDQCIQFAHEATTNLTSNQNPMSLSFLCEQTIILNLNDIPYWHLPTRYRLKFEIDCQIVTIHVFPSNLHSTPLKIKLKRNISIREIQWMLSMKLRIGSPSAITLYVKDTLETLPSLSPLPKDVTELACIVTPPPTKYLQTDVLSVCVSLIGGDVKEIAVCPNTALHEFEEIIKTTFGLAPDSFIYIPSVLSWHNGSYSSHCPLRMHAVLDSHSSSALLLDHSKRNFPTLQGHLTVSEQKTLRSLLLYQMTLHELDLLKAGPIICFEVSGPTIPIAFKTMIDLDSDPTRSLVGIHPHAVSVNPDWSIPVLLKYLSCISGFPCNIIKIGDQILQKNVANDLLQFPWFCIKDSSHYVLPNIIPCAHP